MGTNPFKSRSMRRFAAAAVVLAALPALTSCSDLVSRGFLPGARDTTNNTQLITDLWVNSWIAALAVGVITWGLMIWVVVAYRRRKNTVGFPAQLSYNLPLEVFYLAIPLIVIGVLFVFTDREQRAIDERYDNPDVVIDVFGKQWSWDFNYVKEQVHEDAGQQAHLTGDWGAPDRLPTLYLPVGKKVELHLQSRDLQHSFWVIDFLQKRDLYPGHEQYNPYINITPNRVGEYMGKCAELCGEYHSEMLFKVRVVSQQDYDSHIADLKAKGNTGNLGADFDRQPLSAPAPQVTEPAE